MALAAMNQLQESSGVKFSPGDAEDKKAHKKFHRTYNEGLLFKGWTNERIVYMLNDNGDRTILVLQTDPPAQKNKVEEVVKMMEIGLGTEWIIHRHYRFISSFLYIGLLDALLLNQSKRDSRLSLARMLEVQMEAERGKQIHLQPLSNLGI
ncbi:hypothetical protein K1719_037074 [Acacia pycnantha]|nr:hypothetical protein K1719_037074 [Acacia pycnantha]